MKILLPFIVTSILLAFSGIYFGQIAAKRMNHCSCLGKTYPYFTTLQRERRYIFSPIAFELPFLCATVPCRPYKFPVFIDLYFLSATILITGLIIKRAKDKKTSRK